MVLWKGKQNWQTSGQAHQEKKREDPNKVRNQRGEITTDTTETQKTVRQYHEQLDNLEEMDNFVETYSSPKLNLEEIENLSRPVVSKDIETVIKTTPNTENSRTRYHHWRIQLNF